MQSKQLLHSILTGAFTGSSEQVNEAQSRENERIADEILKNKSKEE